MNSFYSVCKKKSRQMTELVLIGLVMVLFVIASSWGTKIINYFNGPISITENKRDLTKDPHKDSFDFEDPQNQYFKFEVTKSSLSPLQTKNKTFYYTYVLENKENIILAFDKNANESMAKMFLENQAFIVHGGFDILTSDEKQIFQGHQDVIKTLIFREGNIGDSQAIEITISIYTTILITIAMIIMVLLESSGVYMRKTKKQLHALSDEKQRIIDEDYKERLQKNKLGFGDEFLYISKNWHYELYPFEDLILLHYHVHRYGNFNRYTLIGWNVDKERFIISNMLTKEKLMNLLQLIYERNPEITVEKTVDGAKIQLYYFENLIQEMRDRQNISRSLLEVKNAQTFYHRRNNHRLPIGLRTIPNHADRKRKTIPVIHRRQGPLSKR